MAVHDAPQDPLHYGLFDAADLERVEVGELIPDANAGVNKRVRAFAPDQVTLVPPSLDEWLPESHLSRFIPRSSIRNWIYHAFMRRMGRRRGSRRMIRG